VVEEPVSEEKKVLRGVKSWEARKQTKNASIFGYSASLECQSCQSSCHLTYVVSSKHRLECPNHCWAQLRDPKHGWLSAIDFTSGTCYYNNWGAENGCCLMLPSGNLTCIWKTTLFSKIT
jgi:hypothetical protein